MKPYPACAWTRSYRQKQMQILLMTLDSKTRLPPTHQAEKVIPLSQSTEMPLPKNLWSRFVEDRPHERSQWITLMSDESSFFNTIAFLRSLKDRMVVAPSNTNGLSFFTNPYQLSTIDMFNTLWGWERQKSCESRVNNRLNCTHKPTIKKQMRKCHIIVNV